MTPERWLRIEQLFYAALELPPEDRSAFLTHHCGDDHLLLQQIKELLASDNQSTNFLSKIATARGEESEPLATTVHEGAKQISHYRIISKLGAGGMGEVWLAEDQRLDRRVALKILPRRMMENPELLQRFQREARAASALNHPNIITIHEIGLIGQTHFIATEFIEGVTLRERLRQGQLSLAEVLNISVQLVSAMQAAHKAGIVHRDLKPENIMIRPDGLVKVLDFGLARVTPTKDPVKPDEAHHHSTAQGTLIGTPRYMAPEQARGIRVDHRADIFSLGVVIYEMISGRPPFRGETLADQIAAILERQAEPLVNSRPDISPQLERIVFRAMAKDPDQRYQSMDLLLNDLKLLPSDQVMAKGVSKASLIAAIRQGMARVPFRNRYAWMALIMIVALAVVYLGFGSRRGWWPFAQPIPPPLAEALPWYEIGTQAMRDGSHDQAREYFEQAVRKDPRFALARARLAESLAEQDYSDEAQQQLFQVYALIPDRTRLPKLDRFNLEAILFSVSRDYAKAIESYAQMMPLVPRTDEPRLLLDLGLAYEKNYETDKAIESYRQALKSDARSAAAHLRLGIVQGERKKDLAQSEAAFTQAETLYREAGNKEGLAAVYFNRGMINQALSHFDVARKQLQLAADSDNQYLAIRARIHLSENSLAGGQVEQAKQEIDRALELAQKNRMRSVYTLGLIYKAAIFHDTGDFAQAEKYYQEAIQSAQSYNGRYYLALAQNNLGSLQVQQGKLDAGLLQVEPAYQFFAAANYRNEELRALLILARAKRLNFDYDGAQASYDLLLPLAQKSGDEQVVALAHSELAQLYIFQERYPEALPHIDEAYQIYQKLGIKLRLPYTLIRRARVSWQIGDYQSAQTALKDAVPLVTSDDVAHELAIAEAEMFISQLNPQPALRQSRQVLDRLQGINTELRVAALRIHGEALTLTRVSSRSRLFCLEAVGLARSLGNRRILADTLLALAWEEASLAKWQECLTAAQEAQSLFAGQGRPESEWRAWLLLALVHQSSGDLPQTRNATLQADGKLQLLRQLWGEQDYQRYLARLDIKSQIARLTNLSSRR